MRNFFQNYDIFKKHKKVCQSIKIMLKYDLLYEALITNLLYVAALNKKIYLT